MEQNVDGSGYIAVHEQGTADVNVVSLPPQPAPKGRLIELGTQTVVGLQSFQSAFVDVADCERVTLMAKGSSSSVTIRFVENIDTSPDGTTVIEVGFVSALGMSNTGVNAVSWHALEIELPFFRFSILNSSSGTTTDITAWLWCAP